VRAKTSQRARLGITARRRGLSARPRADHGRSAKAGGRVRAGRTSLRGRCSSRRIDKQLVRSAGRAAYTDL